MRRRASIPTHNAAAAAAAFAPLLERGMMERFDEPGRRGFKVTDAFLAIISSTSVRDLPAALGLGEEETHLALVELVVCGAVRLTVPTESDVDDEFRDLFEIGIVRVDPGAGAARRAN